MGRRSREEVDEEEEDDDDDVRSCNRKRTNERINHCSDQRNACVGQRLV